MKNLFSIFILCTFLIACNEKIRSIKPTERRPNIILIMADDMGYECLSANGSTDYHTPVLDKMAANGIRFTKAISQPLCTPSRVKIMTGKYNHRNYEYFTYLNPNQRTFGHIMKDAGYATCIIGKWQLNGIKYKLEGYGDNSRPHHLGFDEYSLWQLTKYGNRFADPLIEQNGQFLPKNEEAYGPDIVSNYAIDFIKRKKDQPFFIYYPMILVHNPFVPTPDSEEWADKSKRHKEDNAFFKDMVEYTDKIIGRILTTLEEEGIADNTIVIFTGDNGTNQRISSNTQNGTIRGAKGNTIDAGTHVPLVLQWPDKIKKGMVYNGLIEFSDFYPTLADIAGREEVSDGQSFYKLISGRKQQRRANAFVHYDPRWSKNVNKFRNQFARTTRYKLYQDGKFYDLENDNMEKHPISKNELTSTQLQVYNQLYAELQKAPKWEAN